MANPDILCACVTGHTHVWSPPPSVQLRADARLGARSPLVSMLHAARACQPLTPMAAVPPTVADSCMGRRMADTAARLTDEVLPRVPVRQWVLSLPYEIRYRLAWDGELVGAVLAVFLRVVYGWYRRQARVQGYEDGRCGSVTFVQRFGSSLNLNPHVHVLMIDGVYIVGEDSPEFVSAPPLRDDDVQQIVEATAQRVVRLLQRRGLLEEGHADPLWEQEPLLATITAASIQGQVATGDGTYRIELSPQELIEKLAALVPPRRLNLVRYHGVLAPNAAARAQIVPDPQEEAQDHQAACCPDREFTPAQRRHRLAWAALLRRVFRVDVTVCPAAAVT